MVTSDVSEGLHEIAICTTGSLRVRDRSVLVATLLVLHANDPKTARPHNQKRTPDTGMTESIKTAQYPYAMTPGSTTSASAEPAPEPALCVRVNEPVPGFFTQPAGG